MAIYENLSEFHGLPVLEFQSAADWAGTGTAYRVLTNWDAEPGAFGEKLKALAAMPDAPKLKAIVIGMWGTESDTSSADAVKHLVDLKDRFAGLTGLFFGDITMEQNEISWIQQTDVSPLLAAFPKLTEFRVRGGNELKFSPVTHDALESLAIETGGLPRSVLRELTRCSFPKLKWLELWLGDEGYGRDGGPEDLQPILADKCFPALESLGICNCDAIDDFTPVIVNAPIISRLKRLDLSKGNLSDVGARPLLDLAKQPHLQTLDLTHHYLSEEMVNRLTETLSCEVIAEDAKDAEDEWRSIYVSE